LYFLVGNEKHTWGITFTPGMRCVTTDLGKEAKLSLQEPGNPETIVNYEAPLLDGSGIVTIQPRLIVQPLNANAPLVGDGAVLDIIKIDNGHGR
jgi:hypothetical protein